MYNKVSICILFKLLKGISHFFQNPKDILYIYVRHQHLGILCLTIGIQRAELKWQYEQILHLLGVPSEIDIELRHREDVIICGVSPNVGTEYVFLQSMPKRRIQLVQSPVKSRRP